MSDLESPDCVEGAGSVVTRAEVSLQPDQDVGVASVQTNPNLGGSQPEMVRDDITYIGETLQQKVSQGSDI